LVLLGCACPRTASAAPAETTKTAAEAWFADFDDQQPYPGKESLKQFLLPVPGNRYDLADGNKNNRPICRFGGLMRLNLPWPANTALRFSFLDARDVRWTLWNGSQGVTLQFCNEFYNAWAAYGAVRQGNQPISKELTLWTTDADRYRRCGLGTLEIHYRHGYLILMRGDLRLLSVPFAGPPQEVYLEGDGLVRGLAMVRAMEVTTSPSTRSREADSPVFPPSPSSVLPTGNPTDLLWTDPPKGVTFQRLPDGCVELRAGDKSPAGQAATWLNQPGFYEVLAQVEDADPGTGIFLGGLDGKQLCRLGVFHHAETGRKIFGPLPIWSADYDRNADVRKVVPYLGPHHWLRLTAGAGITRCWTSGDGIYWSPLVVNADAFEGACRQVGLYCLSGDRPRAIRLRRLDVRRFACLSSLVTAAVLRRARIAGPGVSMADVDAWEIGVAKSWPREVPFDAWWKGCALATLADGPKAPLGQPIFARLQDRVLQDPAELPRAFQFLAEAAHFCPYDYNANVSLERAYRLVGAAMIQAGHHGAFTAVSQAMLRAPIWTEQRLAVFDLPLLREELWDRMGQGRWPEVAELCRTIEFWNRVGFREGEPPPWSEPLKYMVYWAHTQAIGRVPPEAVPPPGTPPRRWKHPLASEVSKDAYNLIAEFNAAVDAQAYQEACQIISGAADTQALGLVPDRKDSHLAVSLPVAVGLAMRETPELKRAMQEKFGALGGLRFRQAAAGGNRTAVVNVALRFPGTEAAAEAHRWLGDRDLAGGRFTEALAQYASSLESSPAAAQEAICVRRRLAAAMLGQDLGPRVTLPVQLGARQFTAEEFEALIQQSRQVHPAGVAARANGPAPGSRSVQAAAHGGVSPGAQAGAHGDVSPDGHAGLLESGHPGPVELHQAIEYESPGLRRHWSMPDRGIDWAGRQTAALAAAGQLLVNNQVDQFAFDLATGQLQWVQRKAVEERQQQWPLVPMRPVCYRDAILVRRLAEDGPELACLLPGDGRPLWSVKPDKFVVSDPLLLGQNCYVITVVDEGSERLGLGLATIDVESGQVRSRTTLAEFRDMWTLRIPCQATLAEGRLVATVGGCVLACRPGSGLEWIRRQLWASPPSEGYYEAAAWCGQVHEPPLVGGGRVFATQPGVWGVQCLDLASGRLIWQSAAGGLVRLAGLVEDRLVVETTEGLFAVDAATGGRLWTHEVVHPLETRVLAGPRAIEYFQTVAQPENAAPQLALVRIGLDNGQVRRRTLLKGPAEKEPLWGPLATSGGRQWLLFAPAASPTKRTIFELTSTDTEFSAP
jgi:outer membrane protein assembly factor BamB